MRLKSSENFEQQMLISIHASWWKGDLHEKG